MFSTKLNELMLNSNLTLSKLSKEVGIPKATLHGYTSGGRDPKLSHLKKLADYFSVTVDYLAFGRRQGDVSIDDLVDNLEIYSGTYKISISKVVPKKNK